MSEMMNNASLPIPAETESGIPEDAAEKVLRLEEENARMKLELLNSKTKLAAILRGAKTERMDYVLQMANLDGIDPALEGADKAIEAAIEQVLTDVPEWRAHAPVMGSLGDHIRIVDNRSASEKAAEEGRAYFRRGMR